jgi:hypothetical protein
MGKSLYADQRYEDYTHQANGIFRRAKLAAQLKLVFEPERYSALIRGW